MKLYKEILSFIQDMHVAWKLTLAYFIIIALPIVVTGIYLCNSMDKTVVYQSGLLAKQSLIQKREIINQKIESIERTSISITYNPQILKYLEDKYKGDYQGYDNYINSFASIFENYTMQNKSIYDTMLYLNNESFPNGWNGIYHVTQIGNDKWYGSLLKDNAMLKNWRLIHDSKTKKYTVNPVKEKVFSLCRKLISFNDKSCIGILEIEISEKTLFENLKLDKGEAEYYLVFDAQGNIVSQSAYKELPERLKTDFVSTLSKQNPNGVFTFGNERLVVYSIPLDSIGCKIVGIIPLKNFLKGSPDYTMVITVVIIVVLIIFGVIIYIVTNRITRRLKQMVKGLKSVRNENINIKMPVENHDEFGELAENFNHMTDRIHDLIERVYKSQIMEKESELKALEAQINPHFLHNTLSTISWMARKINAENIDHISLQLSQFYRLVLSKGKSVITVEDEINLLKAYVEIEKIRFENILHVEYDLDEEALSYKMIKIILQPIAENTINHGILPKDCRGTMIVRLRQDNENLYFTIIDDGIGMSRATMESINKGQLIRKRESGYALHNILERLKSAYGEKSQLSIVSRPGIGCTVKIVIPKSTNISEFLI